METAPKLINNAFYDELGDRWYTDQKHPVALLRAENATRAPWILKTVQEKLPEPVHLLDVGCGAGFLANFVAEHGVRVTGIDLSPGSLATAKRHDRTGSVHYQVADAYNLPYPDHSFDAVCALDLLEHVEDPSLVIAEAARVLRPGGLFFFHTFHRTLLAYLLVIRAVEWFVPATPPHMHLFRLFITPNELTTLCAAHSLQVAALRGLRPSISPRAAWDLLIRRYVSAAFSFRFTRSLQTGYVGYAEKMIYR